LALRVRIRVLDGVRQRKHPQIALRFPTEPGRALPDTRSRSQ
jgi:hypothetical protein